MARQQDDLTLQRKGAIKNIYKTKRYQDENLTLAKQK